MTEPLFLLHTPGNFAVRLGESLAKAFHAAPCYTFLIPEHADRESALAWLWGEFLARVSIRFGSVQVNQDGLAGSFMLAPGRSPSLRSLVAAGLLSFPAHLGWLGSWRIISMGLHLQRLRARHAPMPHWYLLAMGVVPEMQGRGLGYAFLTQVIRRAEADGVPCYLQAFSEQQVKYYEKRGFKILDKEELPIGVNLWNMLRTPSKVEPMGGREQRQPVKEAGKLPVHL